MCNSAETTSGGNPRVKKFLKIYLWIWLWLGVIPFVLLMSVRIGSVSFLTHLGVAVAGLFGPWASQFGRLVDMPNAGGAFNIYFSLACTAILLLVMVPPFFIDKHWLRGICIILYSFLVIGWHVVGFFQLGCCLT